ncbi:MAG: hypothetical protein H6741_09750 [Alphaproteobacteria bacterium]|nr:hypothetical protein [Alphaproteobacteria bacterium]MCB9792995.1 hypothetical protein [Alphaproteobacteria bacterium]
MQAPSLHDAHDDRVVTISRVAVLRTAWAPYEATLSDLGAITVIAGALPLSFATFQLVSLLGSGADWSTWAQLVVLPALLAAAQLGVGEGLRRLDPRSRAPAILLAGALLPLLPLGTLLGIALLSQLLSLGGRTILSPAYAVIRSRTPHVAPPRSKLAVAVGALSLPATLASANLLVRIVG